MSVFRAMARSLCLLQGDVAFVHLLTFCKGNSIFMRHSLLANVSDSRLISSSE